MKALHHAMLAGMALLATTTPAAAGEWKHELAPYLWASSLDGSVGIGSAVANVDASFSDIVDNLEIGFMGMYRASRDRYAITVDSLFMGLGATVRGPGGQFKSDVDVDQIGLSTDFGYAVTERFGVFGGLRYVDLSTEIKTTDSLGATHSADMDENWIDPYIGARSTIPFADAWSATLQGDIGGFGIGSDFAWQVIAAVRWQLSPRTAMSAGYRHLDMDYETGKGSNLFKYDMATSGPVLGVIFTF